MTSNILKGENVVYTDSADYSKLVRERCRAILADTLKDPVFNVQELSPALKYGNALMMVAIEVGDIAREELINMGMDDTDMLKAILQGMSQATATFAATYLTERAIPTVVATTAHIVQEVMTAHYKAQEFFEASPTGPLN